MEVLMNDLISVVVPIYNVEKYLRNCIDSIVSQTYYNLEIILVDDGSPDNCGKIIDEYAMLDKRIKTIHKINGGLSDARNVGIEVATGKYILFVDSDDYIPDDSIEYLYKSLKKNNAHISVGRLKTTSILDENCQSNETFSTIYDTCDSVNQLLYANKYSVAAPGKLFLRSLFDNVRFPVGKLHEDVFTTYKVFLKSEKVYYGNKSVYYYYHRPGSIMVSEFTEKRLHIIEALTGIENEIPIKEFGCEKGFASQNVEDMYMLLALKPGKEIIEKYGIWKRIKKYRKTVLFDNNASKRVRGYALISYLGCHISTYIYLKYQEIKWK